ncbi:MULTISPECIES: DUF6710 family protein [unclassified Ruminococcus]|uniref:DUF6710 family protein n=1 Tax=unclassified Ruminococcus TaxID=2608920 RepID=UPI002109F82E|nr:MULTISPECIES: DUF6710 family protein [unclassified Ruminococcus]MCQ4021737.1 hypothetical protein [Ruminococcus sp. zg-924]MCQ4114181.1 hypothetical protein [Ruminococcus sp. zg-921]
MNFNMYELLTAKDRKRRLDNVLKYLSNSVLPSENNRIKYNTIFYFVKLYANKINFHLNEDTINDKFKDGAEPNPLGDFYSDFKIKADVKEKFKVSLACDPVIADVWNKDRLVESLDEIGSPEAPWVQHKTNHMFRLFLPMGITEVFNGNHSANSGIIKGDGEIVFDTREEQSALNGEIYDMSHLYKDYYYDSYYFRSKADKNFRMKGSFESGCIFEIGRLIHKNNISFISLLKFRDEAVENYYQL